MRWRYALLTHRWFGWHWAECDFAFSKRLLRVRALPNGRRYVRWNFGFRYLDEYERRADRDRLVIPLTFKWGEPQQASAAPLRLVK